MDGYNGDSGDVFVSGRSNSLRMSDLEYSRAATSLSSGDIGEVDWDNEGLEFDSSFGDVLHTTTLDDYDAEVQRVTQTAQGRQPRGKRTRGIDSLLAACALVDL